MFKFKCKIYVCCNFVSIFIELRNENIICKNILILKSVDENVFKV